MEFTIANKELKNAHPNTSRVIMENADGRRMVIQAYYRMRARLSTKVSDDVLMSSVLSTYREDHGIHPESLYVRLLERWEDR